MAELNCQKVLQKNFLRQIFFLILLNQTISHKSMRAYYFNTLRHGYRNPHPQFLKI